MSFAVVAVGGSAVAGLGGALIESNAAQNAAQTQANAANNASQLQYSEYEQQMMNEAPYMNAGKNALAGLQNPQFQQPFSMQDFQQDPGYQFDLAQGNQGIQRAAAANGGLATGGTLKALSAYNTGQASNEYQNAYNRYMTTQNTSFNRLASIAGLGQTANGQANTAGTNMANQVGQNMMGAANAQAGADIGSASAWAGGLKGVAGAGNSLLGYSLLSNLNPSGSPTPMPGGGYAGPGNNFGAPELQDPSMGSQFGGGAATLFGGGAQ